MSETDIKMVMSQTNYTRETAREMLKKHNNDAMNVIREYLNPNYIFENKQKLQNENTSLNQRVFKQFRTFLDDAYKESMDKNNGSLHQPPKKHENKKEKTQTIENTNN